MLFFFHKKGSYISAATPTYFFVPDFPGERSDLPENATA